VSGITKWAVIMCKYSDRPNNPSDVQPPQSFFRDLFTEQGARRGGVFDYIADMSGGAVDMTGSTVHGWYSMTDSLATHFQLGSADGGASDAKAQTCLNAAAADPTFPAADIATYYGIITVFNDSANYYAWGGPATYTVGGVTRLYRTAVLSAQNWAPSAAAHEVLHGYGLPHSNGNGGTAEGDPWDIMSNAKPPPVFFFEPSGSPFENVVFVGPASGPALNAAYRDRLGWIPAARQLSVNTLAPSPTPIVLAGLERPTASGFLMTRIRLGLSTLSYVVELRHPTRWDRGIPNDAVLVRFIQGGEAYLRPATNGANHLKAGDSFRDAAENLTVSVLGIDTVNGTAVVRISGFMPGNITTSAATSTTRNLAGWRTADTRVTLTSSAGAGRSIRSLTFSAGGATNIPATTVMGSATAFTVSNEGESTIVYSAADNTDLVELPRKLLLKIDKTPPETRRQETVRSGGVDIVLSAIDAPRGSGVRSIEYQVMQSGSILTSRSVSGSSATLTLTQSGPLTLHYWAVDNAGNHEGPWSRMLKPAPQFTPARIVLTGPVGSWRREIVTVRNAGETSLQLTPAVIDANGFRSAVFTVRDTGFANTCQSAQGVPVQAGASCQLLVEFRSFGSGVFEHKLVVTQLSWNTPDAVVLTGTAQGIPTATLDATSLAFGRVRVGTPAVTTVDVRNDGVGPLTITGITVSGGDFTGPPPGTCGTVAEGTSCPLVVRFAPSIVGRQNGTLTLTHDANNVAGSQSTVSLSGLGVDPTVGVSPASVTFGSVNVGATGGPEDISITNTSAYNLEVAVRGAPALLGPNAGDFQVAYSKCSPSSTLLAAGYALNPTDVCVIRVLFQPTAAGPRSAVLDIPVIAANPPQQVTLAGNGVAGPAPSPLRRTPVDIQPDTLDFAERASTKQVTVTNTGESVVTIRRAAIRPGDEAASFEIGRDRCSGTSLKPGAFCRVTVAYRARTARPVVAVLEVETDAARRPYEVQLQGPGRVTPRR
jgi:hypothetical protein